MLQHDKLKGNCTFCNEKTIFAAMDLTLLIKGFVIGAAASIPLGPIGVLCIQRTINKNRNAGFFSGMGAAISDTLYAIIAGFSLSYIIDLIQKYELMFEVTGAIVLFFLGIHIFRSHPVKDVQKFRKKGNSYFQDFLITFLLTFSNPLGVFIFLAIFTGSGIVLSIKEPFEALLVLTGIFSGACSWWFILTFVVSYFRHKFTLNVLWWFNKITGILIMIFSVAAFTLSQLEL